MIKTSRAGKIPQELQSSRFICDGGMRLSVGKAALCRQLPYQTKTPITRIGVLFGGGSWIRTSEVSDNRFTVCPLWPLGNSPL